MTEDLVPRLSLVLPEISLRLICFNSDMKRPFASSDMVDHEYMSNSAATADSYVQKAQKIEDP